MCQFVIFIYQFERFCQTYLIKCFLKVLTCCLEIKCKQVHACYFKCRNIHCEKIWNLFEKWFQVFRNNEISNEPIEWSINRVENRSIQSGLGRNFIEINYPNPDRILPAHKTKSRSFIKAIPGIEIPVMPLKYPSKFIIRLWRRLYLRVRQCRLL